MIRVQKDSYLPISYPKSFSATILAESSYLQGLQLNYAGLDLELRSAKLLRVDIVFDPSRAIKVGETELAPYLPG